ncbi:MAG: TetR/AcrR family transcriptional regulator [Flavobacteriales bacterium]|nr:TetR/AcrR family transcriptional regulator [Flavobacteriales bacterium]
MKLKDGAKKEAIIEKTIDVVFQKGFSGVKMAELARLVGISPSTLYVYYKSKEDLIVSICIDLINLGSEKSGDEIREDLPYKLKLKALWLFWVSFSINNAKEMSFLMQVKQSPYYDKVPDVVKENKYKLGFELIDLGKKEGLIKNLDNEIIAAIMGAILTETVKLIMNKTIKFNNKDLDMMFSTFWDAIKN